MSLDRPSLQHPIDGSEFRIAIIAARYNEALVDCLVHQTRASLESAGLTNPQIERVPGSNELPFAVSLLAKSGQFDGIIAVGVVIAGATQHHHTIGESTANALHQIAIDTGTPIINGILVVENQEQAEARAGTKINRGKEFAEAALELAAFSKKWKKNKNL